MLNKKTLSALGFSGLLACGTASAASFSLGELIQVGATLPDISSQVNGADLSKSSGTITPSDSAGEPLTISTLDGGSLGDALKRKDTLLNINGNQVRVSTNASSLESAYDDAGKNHTFNITAVVESRPISLQWEGPLNDIETQNTFDVTLNGQPVTFKLAPGTTLDDFDGNTPFELFDNNGDLLLQGQLNNISASQIEKIAADLGILNADLALRAAQKQFMAQSFGIISTQIDNAMQPTLGGASGNGKLYERREGPNAWVSTEVRDLSGKTANTGYDGDSKTAMVGVEQKTGNFLAGVAAGHNSMDITNKGFGNAKAKLSGSFLAPYGAVSLLNNQLVLDGILLYQDLDGDFSNNFNSVDLDGDRFGARAAATYYFPRFSNDTVLAGITAGGAYMKDNLDGKTLGTEEDYGIELGEAFGGVKLVKEFATGRIYSSATYYEDVTSNVDHSAKLLDNDDDSRTELLIGATHHLGDNMDFNIAARTTLDSSDTEYEAVQATMSYSF